ncbi:MAG: protein-L-isoaspartate O-methyltransferase, partial [Armatimonadetes bacterium]|nr:protein-L-isoaspartate O-methyltransferase [Armatimonadota bacterium]
AERAAMVERLRGSGISNQYVLAAMRQVPRHLFVPSPSPVERARVYEETDVPAGGGQVLYRPRAIALAMQMLEPKPGDKILSVGAGCGHCIAVMAEISPHVYALDYRKDIVSRAEARLDAIGYSSVKWRNSEACKGWKEHAPFDAILVMCAADAVPAELMAQIKEGGRVVIPIGRGPEQTLNCLRKVGGRIRTEVVPMPIRVEVMACQPNR